MQMAECETKTQETEKKKDDMTVVPSSTDTKDPEFLVKHPLQNKWALWYFKNDRSKDWNDNLKVVAKFCFVEDFWA